MVSEWEGLNTMRKHKNSNLAAKPVEDAARSLAPRASWGWFQGMDRWFDELAAEFGTRFGGPLAPLGPLDGPSTRTPRVDLADTGREYVLTAELPGVKREDLDLHVTPEALEVAAQANREREENGKDYAYRERSYESFHRRLAFPEEVLADKVEAKLKDGVLEVRLPKKEPTPGHESEKVRVE